MSFSLSEIMINLGSCSYLLPQGLQLKNIKGIKYFTHPHRICKNQFSPIDSGHEKTSTSEIHLGNLPTQPLYNYSNERSGAHFNLKRRFYERTQPQRHLDIIRRIFPYLQ